MTTETELNWLDGVAPAELSGGTTWGMPFARGALAGVSGITVSDADGRTVPSQAWPLATWPDGSLKWAGVALPATGAPSARYRVTSDGGASPAPEPSPDAGPSPQPDPSPGPGLSPRIAVTESGDSITVSTGALDMVISRRGSSLFTSLSRGGTVVAGDARLVSLLQDGVPEGPGSVRSLAPA